MTPQIINGFLCAFILGNITSNFVFHLRRKHYKRELVDGIMDELKSRHKVLVIKEGGNGSED